ncbi:nuclear transport factor 2 family protein [Solirubrobacter soli]|uniref:nuclear transport factor 2 family protein n=1 Tax=Solirubrobacter soli TaxID=363832 RepID=UPI0003F9E07C|nr:nuclear transport factor 2 family protein [Solirubrobacter soli]
MSAELDDLRARVRVLEDREEIRQLLQEYRRTLDARDMRAYSALFAAEGSWSGKSGSATGPDGIHDMLVAVLPDNPPAPGSTLWHWIGDPTIVVDGDRATASSLWMHVRRGDDDRPLLPTLGGYEDELIREDGRWRFLRRTVSPLVPAV